MLADRSIACPILVGRAPLLAALESWLSRTAANEPGPRVALVAGEAGIGKSRLAGEARAWAAAHGFTLPQGNCFEPDRVLPYGPLLDLLRAWLAGGLAANSPATAAETLRPFAPELVKLLPELNAWLPDVAATPPLDPEQEKRRHFQNLASLLTHLAGGAGPGLLIVEDAHWCDDTSLEFLLFFARRLAAQPARVALLLTYRSDETTPALDHFLAELERARLSLELSLERLSPAGVEAMIRAIFAQAAPVRGEFVAAIHALTDGNPFFVEETLKSLVAAGDIYYEREAWTRKPMGALLAGNRLPRTVQDAVQRRAAALSPAARQLLALAAVAGRRFDFSLLQALSGQSEAELVTLIKELLAAQLVVEETAERFAFRHALTREAVYAQLLERERQALHRRTAEALARRAGDLAAREAALADLAYQFDAAGDWAPAFRYSSQAAERALGLYAPRAAAEYAARALHAAEQAALPVPHRLHRLKGQAHEWLGEFEPARAAYTLALAAARADQAAADEWQSLLDLGFLWTGRDYAQARDYLQQALALARARSDPAALGRSLNRVGNWHTNLDQPDEALACHTEALALFAALDDAAGLAETYDLLGTAYYFGGDIIQGAESYQQAVTLFRRLGDQAGLASSLVMLGTRGANYLHNALAWPPTDLDAAQQAGEEALRLARQVGSRSTEAFASIYLAYGLGPRGDYGRALRHAQTGLDIADDMDHRQWQLAAHMALGLLYHDLLAPDLARQHLEEAVAVANRMGSLFTIRATSGCLAKVYVGQGRLDEAEALIEHVGGADLGKQTQAQRLIHAARVELLLARGEWATALSALDALRAAQPEAQRDVVIPRLWQARGEALAGLGRPAEADAVWQAAAGAAQRPALWRLRRSLGQLYQRTSRPKAAEREFAAARQVVDELAGTLPPGELPTGFRMHALALLPAVRGAQAGRAARQNPGGLTRREREIALLIAAGQTNREIAAALVIGERTVEGHVGNILNKLGFNTRSQIASWSVAQGLFTGDPPK